MPKGGKRKESGRKVGSKDTKGRVKKSRIPIPNRQRLKRYKAADKPILELVQKEVSEESGKLYKALFRHYDDPLVALKALLDDMMVRYNYGRVYEMEGAGKAKKLAFETIEKLKEEGKNKEAASLLETIDRGPILSRDLTHLSGEIRQVSSLIHTIESGGGQGKKNIFLIFNNAKLAKQAENRLFRLPKEVIDAQIVKDEDNDNS